MAASQGVPKRSESQSVFIGRLCLPRDDLRKRLASFFRFLTSEPERRVLAHDRAPSHRRLQIGSPASNERLLRAREVAEALDVSPETVLRWTRNFLGADGTTTAWIGELQLEPASA